MNQASNAVVLREINRALSLCDRGKKSEALQILAQLPSPLQEDREIRTRFGLLCLALGNFTNAKLVFEELDKKHPGVVEYLYYLGDINRELGYFAEAEASLFKCLQIDPDHWRSHASLGALALARHDYEKARESLERALALKPGSSPVATNLASCLMQLGYHEDCITYAKKALKAEPDNLHALNTLGYAQSELGQLEEAERNFQKAIKLDKLFAPAWLNYSRIKKYSNADLPRIKKTESLLNESMSAEYRRALHFAVGKMYDDCGEWSKAIGHFKQANTLGKSVHSEKALPSKLLRTERDFFSSAKLESLSAKLGNTSEKPVFVVGMPRSGTTLVEQIIASHPAAATAGELLKMGWINDQLCPLHEYQDFKKRWNEKLQPGIFNDFANAYLEQLESGRASASRIVDKMPENFHYLGLINILFPAARIIHIRRNALDTCLSCFFHSFTALSWSYDLDWIAARYLQYRDTIEMWKTLLPGDVMLEIDYEELVAEPEKLARSMLEHINLPWDAACLDFHTGAGNIRTASVWQARQPVYRTSVKRWLNYSDDVGELAAALSPVLEDSDIEELSRFGISLESKSWWRRLFS